MSKTNAMRLLEQAHIAYELRTFAVDEEDLSGVRAASAIGFPPERVFKTLVLKGARTGLFACCIPCREEIDLRLAAQAAGDKKAEMLPMKELLGATGYVRGGCSPIGMKRRMPLFIDASAKDQPTIAISAGARGMLLLLDPSALIAYTGARYHAISV